MSESTVTKPTPEPSSVPSSEPSTEPEPLFRIVIDDDGCDGCRKERADKNCQKGRRGKKYTTKQRRPSSNRKWREVMKRRILLKVATGPPSVHSDSESIPAVNPSPANALAGECNVDLTRCKYDEVSDQQPMSLFRATVSCESSTAGCSDVSDDSAIVETEIPPRLDNDLEEAFTVASQAVGSGRETSGGDKLDNIQLLPGSIGIDNHGPTIIVRGTIHQGDLNFSENSRGRQCTAIAMASIAMNYLEDPRYWSDEDVDYILAMGDSLYQASMQARHVIPNEPFPQYLAVEEVLSEFCIGNSVAANSIYGQLLSRQDGFKNLRDILQLILASGSKGILTTGVISVALMNIDGKIGYFDSHSRGPEGEMECEEGTACFMITSDVEHLHDLLIRNICGSREYAHNIQFHYSQIDVQIIIQAMNEHDENVRECNEDECVIDREGCNDDDNTDESSSENSICDMKWIFENLYREFDHHSNDANCSFAKLRFLSTYNKGLSKLMKFKCENCGLVKNISSTSETSTSLDLNSAAIIGSPTIGIGQSQLDELLGALNIRSMSNQTYQKYHGNVVDHVITATEKQMKSNREEEKALAEARGDYIVDRNGVKIYKIDVEGDGGYMKRSYVNSAYTSPACVVVVIGRYTKKILYMEVVQKSCVYCIRGKQHSPAHCYRNHEINESSTSMETKAFERIFSWTLQDNLILKRLVSDGDAKNFIAITNANPYGAYGIMVENILCSNHLKRNISAGIQEISRTRGEIGRIRGNIEESSKTFHLAITRCVEKFNQLQEDTSSKCHRLRADLLKLPFHVYADHSQCSGDNFGCDGQLRQGEQNLVPELQQKNLFNRIEKVMQRAINNANHLLMNLTTNTSESFMAIVAKTIGAKRMHFALKLSYLARCCIAVLLFNTSASIAPICLEMGKDIPQIGFKIQKFRLAKNQQRLVRRAQEDYADNRRSGQFHGADGNYGRVVDPDKIAAELLLLNSQTYVHPSTPKNREALDWGIAFEVVAKQKLRESGFNIRDCGLTMHPSILGIGASADGFIDDDGTLEVKCPHTARMVDPLVAITDHSFDISKNFYRDADGLHLKQHQDIYCQIQGQLAATGRKYGLLAIATTKGVHTMRVDRDESSIGDLMEKCESFYKDCVVPEIVNSRFYRDLPLREPLSKIAAENALKERKFEEELDKEVRKIERELKKSEKERERAAKDDKRGTKRKVPTSRTTRKKRRKVAEEQAIEIGKGGAGNQLGHEQGGAIVQESDAQ
ncbi:hypothetical protein QAD02_012863 [Eretmocerus hayati]|uniref:Uncharacterized protein n=1 Tax=Eretmocerus hayati TaxID=131215 RepID=A0ACC2P0Y1_9HYME|nr:hypothetical protein QAD02_012863 [Eretmocerus hayati]